MTKLRIFLIGFYFGLFTQLFGLSFYESNDWLRLLYYQKTSSGYTSLADNSQFFLTPNGKYDPKGEYAASLEKTRAQDLNFRTQFPLRYKRIAKAHHLDYNPIVTLNSNLTSVMIAYPNRYMANPASMFGHLFLVLKSQHGLPDSTILHYVADTGTVSPYAYILKGLTGQFNGSFFTEPYYRKIKEYTYRDDREVRFYDLTLSPTQIEELQLHAIELKQTYFQYYFLDENCAFFIGKFLNVIYNQDIQKHPAFVLPSDIVNSLEKRHLLEHEYYRGTLTQKFSESYYALEKSEQKQVIDLILKPQPSVPSDSRILKPFLYISDYVLNNYGPLAESVRKNRILAYQTLEKQGQSHIRPLLEQKASVQKIPSKALSLGQNPSSAFQAMYHHIYYGNSGDYEHLDTKYIQCLTPGISIYTTKPALFECSIAEIATIAAYNDVLNSNSWRLKSWFGYQTEPLITQSFEYGRAYRPFSHTLITGLAGFSISNFNDIIQTPLPSLTCQPTARLELAQLLHRSVRASIGYDYRFERHHLQLGFSFRKQSLEGRLFYLASENHQGVYTHLLRRF